MNKAEKKVVLESVLRLVSRGERLIITAIINSEAGLSTAQICEKIGLRSNQVSGRVTHLRRMGLVRDSGVFHRVAGSHKHGAVWEYNPERMPPDSDRDYLAHDDKAMRDVMRGIRKRVCDKMPSGFIQMHVWEVIFLLKKFKRVSSTAKRFHMLKTPQRTWKWKRWADDRRFLASLADILDDASNHHVLSNGRFSPKITIDKLSGAALVKLVCGWIRNHRLPDPYRLRISKDPK